MCLRWFAILALSACSLLFSETGWGAPRKPQNARKPKKVKRQKTYKLPTIQVKSQPPEDFLMRRDPSGFSSTISIAQGRDQGRELGQILQEQAGVQVRSMGGAGAWSLASIRGSTASQVLIVLDGVPLNSGGSASINLGDLPVGVLKDVTIFRGFVPAHLGGAMGGAIVLSTRLAKGSSIGQATATVGAFRQFRVSGFYGHRWKNWQITALAQYAGYGGDFLYFDDRGTPLSTADDLPSVYRWNNHSHAVFGLLGAHARLHRLVTIHLTDFVAFRASGVPGLAQFRSLDASLQHLRNILQATFSFASFPTSSMRSTSQLYWLAQSDLYRDRAGEIGVGRQDLDNQLQLFGWKWLSMWLPLSWLSVSFSSHLRREGYSGFDRLAADEGVVSAYRWQWTPVLQSTASLFGDTLLFLLAGRLSFAQQDADVGHSTLLSGWKADTRWWPEGRLGVRWAPLSWLHIQTNAGRYVRQPTFSELFGDRGAVIGNPRLTPESGWMWDGGFALSIRNKGWMQYVQLAFAVFVTGSEQLIRFVQNSQRTMIAVNIDQALVAGHEVRLQFRGWKHVSLRAEWTWMDARNTSSSPIEKDNFLPGRPQASLFVEAGVSASWGRVFYSFRWTSSNFLDRANLKELAARQFHRVGVSLVPARLLERLGFSQSWYGLTVHLTVSNLLDSRVESVMLRPALPNLDRISQAVSDFRGYPIPGRSVQLTVDWKL